MVVVMVVIRRHTVMKAMLVLCLVLQIAVVMVVMSRIALQGV
jgi:hypothetical protein